MTARSDEGQVGLFDTPPRPPTEQEKQIKRVRGRIHRAILAFFDRLEVGEQFTMVALTREVASKVPSLAPDSPGRIMRLLRREGKINYKVVSRAQSLYAKKENES